MAIYFFDKNQTLIKIVPESATFEAIQTQELDGDSLLKDTLSVTVKSDEKLLGAEYMAVKSYKGNAQTFDMYRIVTDTTPDKSMSFTGMSLAPYELKGHIIQDLRPTNQTISYTLNRVLDGTDWHVGYIEEGLSNVTTNFYYVSAKEALKELQSLVGCEFVFKVEISGQKITDKWIEVYKEMGNRTKKRFNYGTNALTVVRETNKADIFTALIGRGKGEEVTSADENESGQAGYGRKITFEDIEWSIAKGDPLDKPKGQYYLELPQATQVYGIKNIDGTMSARVGVVDFDDETDKNRLINLTYQQLLVSSRPKVLFKTTVANIGATGIGDTVTIHRHDLGIHYQTRVRKIVRNKLNDNKTQIELGDAVVTASTKRAKENNATIKNLNQEIEKVKADVTISQTSADGKNTIFYGSAEPTVKRTGDTWYRPHPSIAGETQMLVWNGTAWELVIDTSDLTSVSRAVEDAAKIAGEAVQAAKDADTKANDAIAKAGANANLLTTHQNTIDTINTVTLPDIASSAGTALADAKSAMDEAKKADGKIADYVTKNGLVNGTTVDSKIDEATGEISRKITTVESKIPTEIGGRNYYARETTLSVLEAVSSLTKAYDINGFKATGASSGNRRFRIHDVIKSNGAWTISGYFRGTQNTTVSFNVNLNDLVDSEWFTSTRDNTWKYFEFSGNVTNQSTTYNFINFRLGGWAHYEFKDIKVEKGTIATDWSPAPEDNYSKEEFKIFESTYNEDVKGINSTLTELSNKKLDGTTYTDFYTNEYKKTAQGVTDTYAKVNKIIDANGNLTDTFAKAVYDRNATRQTADFKLVTKDLVTTTTYSEGIKGINESITSVRGDLSKLASDGRNYFKESDVERTGSREFVNSSAWDMAPIIDKFGTDTYYTISFDIKSKVAGNIRVYAQNGTGTKYSIGEKDINVSTTYKRFSYTFKPTLSSSTETMSMLAFFGTYESGRIPTIKNVKFEVGSVATDWTPAIEDLLGKADFQIFKGEYERNDQTIKNRLTAIDSSAEGSVVTRLNKTESTASGNSQLISTINKNYVKQSNIDASILADKQIKDTRSANQLPSWYFTNYPSQEVREFKQVSTMGVGSGTYGILTTNVPWRDDSGGTVKQKFETNTETHVRQSNSAGTAWGAWSKQIDTADTTYQKITQTSSLYERVIGSTEANVKNNMARIVMADNVFKTEVIEKTNVDDSNTFSSSTNVSVLANIGSIVRDDPIAINGFRITGAQGNNGSFRLHNVITSNGWWTVSGWVRGSQNIDIKFTIDICYVPSDKQFNTGTKNEWQYFEFSHNVTNATSSRDFVDFKGIEWMHYYFKDIKVEKNHHATAWTPSAIDFATQSNITQLADNINLKVSKGDLLSQINVQAGGVLITSGTNKLNVTPKTTYIENGTIKSAMIESLLADKITAGTLDAGKVKVINLDANNITANKTSFVQSAWNAINSRLSVTGSELKYTHSDGSYTRINANGIQTVVGGSAYQHNYLMHVENITINSNSGGEVKWVQLPSVFKGKQFRYFMGATDIYGAVTEDAYFQNKLLLKRFVLIKHPDYNVDYANARIPVLGYAHYADIDSRKAYFRALQGIVVAQF